MSLGHLQVPVIDVGGNEHVNVKSSVDIAVEGALRSSTNKAEALEHSVSSLQSGLLRFHDLLKQYEEVRAGIDRNDEIIRRASEAWVPDIRQGIEQALTESEKVLRKIPSIEEKLAQQISTYNEGRRHASEVEVQLEWYAASWMIKLRKVLLGEVKEKRTKLLRIAAPFLLGFVILLLIGSLGSLFLRWAFVYYRKIQH